jgi:hypothetical protein
VKQEHFRVLAGATNAQELEHAIQAICQPFASPKDIYILPDSARNVYVCYLGGGSSDLNSSMIENLGGFYFANGVAFTIPFKLGND